MVRRKNLETTDETRQRLLNRLGYFKESIRPAQNEIITAGDPFLELARQGSTASLDSAVSRTVLRKAMPFQQPLHDDPATSKIVCPSPRSVKVKFSQVVSGVEIPSRHQYSNRIKNTMWANRHEISAMVERNSIEFESEGYDWKNVVLDSDMYVNEVNGELIHPCHYGSKDPNDQEGQDEDYYFPALRRHNSVA